MADPQVTPVDYDPFAAQTAPAQTVPVVAAAQPSSGVTPVDYDPFAQGAPAQPGNAPALPAESDLAVRGVDQQGMPFGFNASEPQKAFWTDFNKKGYRDASQSPGSAANPMFMSRDQATDPTYQPPKGTYYVPYGQAAMLKAGDEGKGPVEGTTSLQDLAAGANQGTRDIGTPLSFPAIKQVLNAETADYNSGPSAKQTMAQAGRFGVQQAATLPITAVTDGLSEAAIPALESVPLVGRPAAAALKFATGRAGAPLAPGAPVLAKVGNAALRTVSRSAGGALYGAEANAVINQDPTAGAAAGALTLPVVAPAVNAGIKLLTGATRPAINSAISTAPKLLSAAGADNAASQAAKIVPIAAPMPKGDQIVAATLARSLGRDNVPAATFTQNMAGGRLPLASGGENLAGLGETLAQTPGPGRSSVLQAVNGRQMGVPGRVMDAVTDQLGVDPRAASGDIGSIVSDGQARAKPLFDAATASPTPVWNADLAALAQRPAIKDAMKTAATGMLNRGQDPMTAALSLDPDTGWTFSPNKAAMSGDPSTLADATEPQPTAATWDRVYKALGQNVERHPITNKTLPNSVSSINDDIDAARIDLRSALAGDPATGDGGAIPGYNNALKTSADYLSTENAFDRAKGRLFNGPVSQFASLWDSAGSQGEQDAIRAGMANDILELSDRGRLQPGAFKTPGVQQKLQIAFGGQTPLGATSTVGNKGPQAFIDNMEQQAQERATYANVTGNSRTAFRTAAQDDASHGFDPEEAVETLLSLHNPPVLAVKGAKAAAKAMKGANNALKNPQLNARLGQALSDPGAAQGLLDAYQAEIARRSGQFNAGRTASNLIVPAVVQQATRPQTAAQPGY